MFLARRWTIAIAIGALGASCGGDTQGSRAPGPTGGGGGMPAGGSGGAAVDAGGSGGASPDAGGSGGALADAGGSGGSPAGGASSGGAGAGGAGTGGGSGGTPACCGPGVGCPCPPPGGGPGGGAGGCYSACVGGVCKHDFPVDGCWVDHDCGDRECVGAQVCGCGASCLEADRVGRCEPAEGCCAADSECGDAGARRCVEGVCQDGAPSPSCWLDTDCGPNQGCLGALLCPCGASCYTAEHPGTCGCCAEAADCGDTYALTCAAGRCLDRLLASGCWSDTMCPLGQACQGARVCPCGASCVLPDAPGTCG